MKIDDDDYDDDTVALQAMDRRSNERARVNQYDRLKFKKDMWNERE